MPLNRSEMQSQQSDLRIAVYGFERLGFQLPDPADGLHFLRWDCSESFADFDGVMIPNGIFEKIQDTGPGRWSPIAECRNPDLMMQRDRELEQLIRNKGWVCFLVVTGIQDQVADGGFGDTVDASATDLCKLILNSLGISRRQLGGSCGEATEQQFARFIQKYGVARAEFSVRSNSTVLVRAGHHAVGFEVAKKLFFLPFLTARRGAEDLESAMTLLAASILEYVQPPVAERPDWLHDYLLPDQQEIVDRIALTEVTVNELALSLEADRKALEDSLELQQVLTASGDQLERSVLSLLERLGGTIEIGPHKNRDDGRVTDSLGRKFILEIKGRQKSLKLEDIRQLRGWIDTAARDEGITGKGLFIGNGYLCERPKARPPLFPDNALQEARSAGFCLITVPQLLEAVRLMELRMLSLDTFWNSISCTVGLYSFAATATTAPTS